MKIVLTEHASMRMTERDITIEDIKYVLKNHDFSIPSKKGGTELWRHFPDGRELKVWIVQQLPLPKRVIIKSAGWRNQ